MEYFFTSIDGSAFKEFCDDCVRLIHGRIQINHFMSLFETYPEFLFEGIELSDATPEPFPDQ